MTEKYFISLVLNLSELKFYAINTNISKISKYAELSFKNM